MDNVLKLILGFLGLVALVILAIPSSDTDDEARVVKPIAAPKPTPKAVSNPSPSKAAEESDEKPSKDDDWGDDEFESFGQPMNDAKPLGVVGNSTDDGGPSKGSDNVSAYPVGSPAMAGGSREQAASTDDYAGN